jgi:hypothetical protein
MERTETERNRDRVDRGYRLARNAAVVGIDAMLALLDCRNMGDPPNTNDDVAQRLHDIRGELFGRDVEGVNWDSDA